MVFAIFGVILVTLMFCICIIVLKLKGIICRGRGVRQRDVQREVQRAEELRTRVLEKLEEVLPTKDFNEVVN